MSDTWKYLLRDSVTNIGRSGWSGVVSISTIGVAFLIIGVFLLLSVNLGGAVARWKEEFQVTVFLEDTISPSQRGLLEKQISQELAVKAISFTSKEEALAQFKRELKGQESLLAGLGENPLPASFHLKIREGHQTTETLKQLAAFLSRLEGVEDVLYGQEWIERLALVVHLMKILGLTIGAILAVGSLLIVSNTIRLAVYARAAEIEVMRLVGATTAYIRTPYLLEGILQGTLGAGLATVLLYAGHWLVVSQLSQISPTLLYGVGGGSFLTPSLAAALVGAGALVGAFGSLVSVRRFLRT